MEPFVPSNATTTSFVALLQNLRAASSFEDAAKAALGPMLDFAAASLTGGVAAQRPHLLRAVVHLRHDDGYLRLFGLDYASREEFEGTGYLTSTRIWEWVAEHRCAVSIDVMLGFVTPHGIQKGETTPLASSLSAGPGVETRERLLGRDASHVHVIEIAMDHTHTVCTNERAGDGQHQLDGHRCGVARVARDCGAKRATFDVFENHVGSPPRAIHALFTR